MYWIYLILFAMAVLTPEVVSRRLESPLEEHIEAALVFLFGAVGFFIYVAKDKALLRIARDRLRLQREKHDMTRDLSDSYSYIGEVNRRMDVAREFIRLLPGMLGELESSERKDLYLEFSKSAVLFAKAESFSLRVVDCEKREIAKEVNEGDRNLCERFSAEKLLSSERAVWKEGECLVVRSPDSVGPYRAFLVFGKSSNATEDIGMLEALASEGLALFFLERNFRPHPKRRRHYEKHLT